MGTHDNLLSDKFTKQISLDGHMRRSLQNDYTRWSLPGRCI